MTEDVLDLRDADGLRTACHKAESAMPAGEWERNLATFLDQVAAASESQRATEEFQRRLWEANPVCNVGMGTVNIEQALKSKEFRAWLATESMLELPQEPVARIERLTILLDEIVEKLKAYASRKPHLKVYRAMAALFPQDFTVMAERSKLRKLHEVLFGVRGPSNAVRRHANVLGKLQEVLGPAGEGTPALVRRMTLPWKLYATFVDTGKDAGGEPEDAEAALRPLPAARRRRGLTATAGSFNGMLDILEYLKDGVTRADLLDYLRARSPEAKESSLNITVNVLQSEFGVMERQDDKYVLTDRGEAVLESGEPDELCDWLLTRVLGPDYVLALLRDEGPMDRAKLTAALKAQNPGWTTDFGPRAILLWLRSLAVIETLPDGTVRLTPAGERWAGRIQWKPESLQEIADPPLLNGPPAAAAVELPELDVIIDRVSSHGHFSPDLIAQVHSGVWAHLRRHFLVLTGLSGSGKTLLARAYATALGIGEAPGKLIIVPVEPGWHDTGALLGYVNPLRSDSYVRTAFLDFLIEASSNPGRPYTVVLDEMNLSHPEHYLAPLLSAMETGAPLVFHSEGDSLDGIPSSIPYPGNLVIIGTVNMDETTHALSDKVLDRAHTIEFWQVDLDRYPRWSRPSLAGASGQQARKLLTELNGALAPARLHFGWRTIDDVLDFLEHTARPGGRLSFVSALDAIIHAKVLPRLRGSDSERVRQALAACRGILDTHGLQESSRKVQDLMRDLEETGSARFWR